jgi:hypothetical protein
MDNQIMDLILQTLREYPTYTKILIASLIFGISALIFNLLMLLIVWLQRNDYLQIIFRSSIPSIFIGLVVTYAFSNRIISLNNFILLFVGVTIGTVAAIFRSKKTLFEKNKISQDSKE